MHCFLQEALHDYPIPSMGPPLPLGSLAILVFSLEEFIGNHCSLACLNPYEILVQVPALGPISSLFLSSLLPHSLSPWVGMAFGTLADSAKHIHTLWPCLRLPKVCLSFLQGQQLGCRSGTTWCIGKGQKKRQPYSSLAVGPQEGT